MTVTVASPPWPRDTTAVGRATSTAPRDAPYASPSRPSASRHHTRATVSRSTAAAAWAAAASHPLVSLSARLSASVRSGLPAAAATTSRNSPTVVTPVYGTSSGGSPAAAAAALTSASLATVWGPTALSLDTWSVTTGTSALTADRTRGVATTNGSDTAIAMPLMGAPVVACTARAASLNGGFWPESNDSDDPVTHTSTSGMDPPAAALTNAPPPTDRAMARPPASSGSPALLVGRAVAATAAPSPPRPAARRASYARPSKTVNSIARSPAASAGWRGGGGRPDASAADRLAAVRAEVRHVASKDDPPRDINVGKCTSSNRASLPHADRSASPARHLGASVVAHARAGLWAQRTHPGSRQPTLAHVWVKASAQSGGAAAAAAAAAAASSHAAP